MRDRARYRPMLPAGYSRAARRRYTKVGLAGVPPRAARPRPGGGSMNALARTRIIAAAVAAFALPLPAGLRADEPPKPAAAKTSADADEVTPKPLSDAVKKGLDYLAKQQHPNGGWGQGGGWRVGGTAKGVEGVTLQ